MFGRFVQTSDTLCPPAACHARSGPHRFRSTLESTTLTDHAGRGPRHHDPRQQGPQARRARLHLEPSHRGRLDRPRLQPRRDARLHRRGHRHRRSCAGRADRRVHPDPVRVGRLSLPEPRRPRRRHDVRVDHAGVRAPDRLDQRLGDLPRRHHRDGVAGGDRGQLHLPPVQLARGRELELRDDRRRGAMDRADDLDLLPGDRALGSHPDGASGHRAVHARYCSQSSR